MDRATHTISDEGVSELTNIEQLLQRVVANPSDTATRLVLADAWIEAGDLRGDLVQVQHALMTAKGPRFGPLFSREESLVKLLRRRILGPKLGRSSADLSFALGFVDEVALDVSDDLSIDVLRAVCASEMGAVLRSLALRVSIDDEGDGTHRRFQVDAFLSKLAKNKLGLPPSLVRLELCAADRVANPYGINVDTTQQVSRIFKVFPSLRELRVEIDHARLPRLHSTTLTSFEWLASFIAPLDLSAMGGWELPALERFALVVSTRISYGNAGQRLGFEGVTRKTLEPVFDLLDRAPHLRELSLRKYAGRGSKLVKAMSAHAFFSRVERLELEGIDVDDACADALACSARRDLKLTVGSVTDAARAKLAAHGVSLVVVRTDTRAIVQYVDEGDD